MAPEEICWRSLPVFREKSPAFLEDVATYLEDLGSLNLQQRRNLAVFKAAELINALIQIRDLIDAGCRLFHAGQKDAEVYRTA